MGIKPGFLKSVCVLLFVYLFLFFFLGGGGASQKAAFMRKIFVHPLIL